MGLIPGDGTYSYDQITYPYPYIFDKYPPFVNSMIFGRYLWVWTTDQFLGNNDTTSSLISRCLQFNIKTVFLNLNPKGYIPEANNLQTLLGALIQNGINPWGVDGGRKYLSDEDGPAVLFQGVDNLLAYNALVPENARFYGFQTDIELQDDDNRSTFHDTLADSQLDPVGGGVWKTSQVQDRRALTADWLNTHALIKAKLAPTGLKLGAAIPFWFDQFYGEPVMTGFNERNEGLFQQLARIADEIHIMSYNTNPSVEVDRISFKMQYLSTSTNVTACASVETNKNGGGPEISYGDNSSKNNQNALFTDLTVLEDTLKKYSAFKGICIEDYDGLQALLGQ
jgi:hypothetical protein